MDIRIFWLLKNWWWYKAPNEYSIPSVLGSSKEAHIRSAPAYTLVGRQKTILPTSVRFPGPGAYDGQYEAVTHKSPQFSMGQRITKHEKVSGPGPGSHWPERVENIYFNWYEREFSTKSIWKEKLTI